MKFLIIGMGSIGNRHAKNCLDLFGNVMVYRSSKSDNPYQKELEDMKGDVQLFYDLDKALAEKPDACIISNPTAYHIETFQKIKDRCKNILLEKPVSDSLEGLDKLKGDGIVMIAYNMRFLTLLQKVKELLDQKVVGKVNYVRAFFGSYLPGWRRHGDYRKCYSAKKGMGGGVLLDLSHEIDYIYWYFGMPEKIVGMSSKVSQLEIDSNDCSELLMKYPDMMCSIHVDYFRRDANRHLIVLGSEGTMKVNLQEDLITVIKADGSVQDIQLEKEDRNDMYKRELEHFADCIKNKKQPMITLEDGINVLKICMEVTNV